MRKIIAVILIFTLEFVLINVTYGQKPPEKNTLTMGKATMKAQKGQEYIESIIKYLVSKIKDVGIDQGEVVLVRDNETVIGYLKEGKLDIVIETPFSAYIYMVGANATPILLAKREGVSEYNSFIFARKDSGIRRLEDLKGKVIAFEDPGSTSGYFLPKYSIEEEGLDCLEIESPNFSVPEDKIGYVFAGQELNISSWVFFKKVDAGTLSNLDWHNQEENPRAFKKEFKIIYETQKIPRMLVMAREGLDKILVTRIKEELLNMDKGEEGREALKGGLKISKFVEMPEGLLESVENLFIEFMEKEVP